MKVYTLTNVTKFTFQVIAKSRSGQPGFIYTVKSGESIELEESQLTGDVQLKLKKRLFSSVESERVPVISTFSTAVELESDQKPPLSARGKIKKIV